MTLKRSLKVIQTGTIRKIGCSFLFAFHSIYGRIFSRLWDIQCQSIAWPWKLGYGLFKVIENGTIWKLGCGFLFAFHGNYGSILYRFGDNTKYWSKIAIFFIPPCIRRLCLGVPIEILPYRLLWNNQYGVGTRRWKRFIMFSRFDKIPACDRQTDGHLATA